MGARIAIVIHHNETRFRERSYLIVPIIEEWKRLGHEINIVRGPTGYVPADVAVAHIDLTRIPPEYQELLARYPSAINGRLIDISKSRISSLRVESGRSWSGPVIVKTDLNTGGAPERLLNTGTPSLQRRLLSRWRRLFAPPSERNVNPGAYPVYPTLDRVPAWIRKDDRFVIERFLPERDGERYVLRHWVMLGSRGVCLVVRSDHPVVKANPAGEVEVTAPPEGLLSRARELGMDYGKIDFVLHEGEPVILDVNRTPVHAGSQVNERHRAIAKTLAAALEEFL